MVLILKPWNAFIMNWSGITRYTFESVIFFDGLISFHTVISLSMYIYNFTVDILLCFFINSSALFWLLRNNQKRLLKMRETAIILVGAVNWLIAVKKSICFIYSIAVSIMARFILGVYLFAVVSAKLFSLVTYWKK